MSAPHARNGGIDVLRGLSILLVVVHHVAIRIPLRTSPLALVLPKRALNALSYNGYEAVFVFFVISGFLITSHARSRWGALPRIHLRTFYARRFARIAPCLALLVAVLAALHLARVDGYVIARPGQSLPRAVLAVVLLHLNWYEGVTGYLPGSWDVLWSLSIEETFYLGFPLFCRALHRERIVAIALFVLAASLPFAHRAVEGNQIWQEKAYLPGVAAIATGCLAALVPTWVTPKKVIGNRVLAAVGATAIASVLVIEDLLWKVLADATLLVLTIGTAILLVALTRLAALGTRPLPGLGWLRAWGRSSYEIYLTHMFVVLSVVAFVKARAISPTYAALAYLPVVILAWALGEIVARRYSIPAEQALRPRLLG